MSKKRLTIVLADDEVIFREGLRLMLKESGMKVVGEASDGFEALRLIKGMSPAPDLLLTDVKLPRLNGIDLTQRVAKLEIGVRTIILSGWSSDRLVVAALRAGAMGFVGKAMSYNVLHNAIIKVMTGEMFLDRLATDIITNAFAAMGRYGRDARCAFDVLSVRQRQVLQMFAEGSRTREMAEQLDLSMASVQRHLRSVMTKLNLRNPAELVKYAVQQGLVII